MDIFQLFAALFGPSSYCFLVHCLLYCAARWKGTAARLALLVSLCGGGGGGQARPSRLPAGGGCEVLGGGHGDTARFSCSSCAARWYGLEKAQGKF